MEYVSEIELEKSGLKVEDDGIYVVKVEHVDDLLMFPLLNKNFCNLVSLKRPIVKAYKKSLEKPVKVADSLVEYHPDKREIFCTKFLKPERHTILIVKKSNR